MELHSTVLLTACDETKSADLVIKVQGVIYNLTIKDEELLTLAQVPNDQITEARWLASGKFDCEYNHNQISKIFCKH